MTEAYKIMHYGGKNMKKILVVGIILLFLGSSLPALAKTQVSSSNTIISKISTSPEDYNVFIGAGMYHKYGTRMFGVGWHMTVENIGDTNITGFMYVRTSKLSGDTYGYGGGPFHLLPGEDDWFGLWYFNIHLVSHINLTVIVENTTYSRTGYEIGPFVLLVS